jgi:hypothetical protein
VGLVLPSSHTNALRLHVMPEGMRSPILHRAHRQQAEWVRKKTGQQWRWDLELLQLSHHHARLGTKPGTHQ